MTDDICAALVRIGASPSILATEGPFDIRERTDAQQMAVWARRFATSHGCADEAAWRFATLCAELASNALKHSGGGSLSFLVAGSPDQGRCFAIAAASHAPFVGELTLALKDGVSRGREVTSSIERGELPQSLGVGLGAVSRLSDGLDIQTGARGTLVVAIVRAWSVTNLRARRPS